MKTAALAFAKLNLSLDVTARMPDGYHSMRMVMQSVDFGDDIDIECLPGARVEVMTNLSYIPGDDRNIAVRAAKLFFSHTGVSGYGARIVIHKRIPVCAGLGGSSTDGAAVLRAMNELFDTGLGRRELEALGARLGSDVAFCVAGGTALAEGRGERLTDLTPLPDCHVVIAKPSFSVGTPELFGRLRCERIRRRPDTDGLVAALERFDLGGVARRMYNIFEDVMPRGARELEALKGRLLDHGAVGTVMTGTGSAVFGLFADEGAAASACRAMKDAGQEVYLTRTLRRIL